MKTLEKTSIFKRGKIFARVNSSKAFESSIISHKLDVESTLWLRVVIKLFVKCTIKIDVLAGIIVTLKLLLIINFLTKLTLWVDVEINNRFLRSWPSMTMRAALPKKYYPKMIPNLLSKIAIEILLIVGDNFVFKNKVLVKFNEELNKSLFWKRITFFTFMTGAISLFWIINDISNVASVWRSVHTGTFP